MTEDFLHILFGSLALSLVHASIPNHWLPLVAISKSEKWSEKESIVVSAIAAMAHTVSSIAIGIIIGVIGYKLSSSYEFIMQIVAPVILIGLGLVYLLIDYRENKTKHHHHHHIDTNKIKKAKSKTAIIFSLAVAMFFSPCLEIEAYYFTASKLGWLGIFTVSIVYFFVTVTGIVLLVHYGLKGVEKFNFHFMEHHEKLVAAIVLIIFGILMFFIG